MGGIKPGVSRHGEQGSAYLITGRAGQSHGGFKEHGRFGGHLKALWDWSERLKRRVIDTHTRSTFADDF